VSSQIEGTMPMMARRKLKQGMKVVLDTWTAQQRNKANIDIPEDVANSLFLTWKGNKIYSHSTAASLGVRVGPHGELEGNIGEGYQRGGLHLEVWTEEAYAYYLKRRDEEMALRLGIIDDDLPGSNFEKEPSPVPEKRKGIRVILKAKELEPLKTKVYDDTMVGTLINVFRTQRGVSADQAVSIFFDGERLDEDSLVKDADIDPEETTQLEVHIK
jgi:Ubiquitin-2 like Rad60 SUMO-like